MSTSPVVVESAGPLLAAVWVAACTIGGLVPDLDMPGAMLSRLGWPVTWWLALFLRWLSVQVYYLTKTPQDRRHHDGHRGLTHTAIFCPVFGAALFGVLLGCRVDPELAMVIAQGITVGSWAHIAGDCCTFWGCPVWWPIILPWSGNRRWYCVGIPRALRFAAGGLDDDQPGNWWQAGGEKVATAALWVFTVLAAFGKVPGGYEWVFDTVGQLAGSTVSWMI